MSRALLRLWPLYWRPLLVVAVAIAQLPALSLPWAVLCGGLAAAWVTGAVCQLRWVWKLATDAKTFRTVSTPWVVLHHSPQLRDPVLLRAFHRTVETQLHDLAHRFGRPLRTPVVIYLFAETRRVGQVFGPQYGGCALWAANAIVLASDSPWEELVRHELAHLFAGRWSRMAPPVLAEGLAVWVEGSRAGRRIDAAREALDRREVGLDLLLDRRRFFAPENMTDCYALAGSFTGFLMRRFGWDAYRRLYRMCDGRRFGSKFQKCFGLSLEDAHWEWRLELRMGTD